MLFVPFNWKSRLAQTTCIQHIFAFVMCSRQITSQEFDILCYTGCPKKKDTVTLSHNFRLDYSNSKFEAGM